MLAHRGSSVMITFPSAFQGVPLSSHYRVPTPDLSPFLTWLSPAQSWLLRQGERERCEEGERGRGTAVSGLSLPASWLPAFLFFQGDRGEALWEV